MNVEFKITKAKTKTDVERISMKENGKTKEYNFNLNDIMYLLSVAPQRNVKIMYAALLSGLNNGYVTENFIVKPL